MNSFESYRLGRMQMGKPGLSSSEESIAKRAYIAGLRRAAEICQGEQMHSDRAELIRSEAKAIETGE